MLRSLISIQVLLLTFLLNINASPRLSENTYASLVPNYDLTVKLLPEDKRLEVSGNVRLPAISAAQDAVPALLSEEMRDFRVDVVSPIASAGVAKVEAKGKAGGRVFYMITPVQPFAANEPLLLRFSYIGGEKGGFVFHLGSDGSFAHGSLSAWYPLFDAGEYTGHVGTLKFSVPEKYVVIATGTSQSSVKEMTQGNYRFDVTSPAVFSFAAATYTIARRTDKPRVGAYILHPRPNIDAYLEKCSKVLDFLARQFGRYPNDEFSLVEIPTEQAAGFFGASSPGIVFIPGKFIDSSFDCSLHGHEISHQWWGGTIGVMGSKGDEMLIEGMAQFGSLLTVENLEGSRAAQGYRQTGYPSIGKFNFSPCEGKNIPIQSLHGYLMLTSNGGDQRLDSLEGELAHSLAVSKGFLVFDLLSRTVGREQFRKTLMEFSRQNAYRAVKWEDFVRAIEVGAGKDLKWFYEQWFERTGAPDLNVTWKQDGKVVHGVITQTAPFYQLDVELQATGESIKKHVVESVEIHGAQTEFTLAAGFDVRSVVLDPEFLVPHWTAEYHAEADEIKRCASR